MRFFTLNDFPGMPDVAENGASFFENALLKARFVSEWTGKTSLADDSGLEVEALGGKPGILSARYSGKDATDRKNIQRVLGELKGLPAERRKAAFRCVLILYYPDGRYENFEGVLQGIISDEPRGNHGFGYDPIFIVPEFGRTAAEIPPELKNRVSHRARALQKLKDQLQKRQGSI